MQIKRYKVNSINEAMKKIKKDLGPDAIVLSSNKVEGERGSYTEVVAARDDNYGNSPAYRGGDSEKEKTSTSCKKKPWESLIAEMNQLKSLMMDIRREKDAFTEIAEMREVFGSVLDVLGGDKRGDHLSPSLSRVYYKFIASGVSRKRAFQIIQDLKTDYLPEDLKDYENALRIAEDSIKQEITPFYKKNIAKRKIAAFVGPTGAGKTTTLAKLAAGYLFRDGLSVGVVTTDTYRIGAMEQLKIYADIMDIPVEIASEKRDFQDILNKFSEKDIILVDTPGKSHNDENYLLRLKEFLVTDLPLETNLILSMTASHENLISTASSFGITHYDNVIFTKMDEANNYGSIYNVINHVGKPVLYVTTGQNVPQDIEKVDPGRLAKIVVENRMN